MQEPSEVPPLAGNSTPGREMACGTVSSPTMARGHGTGTFERMKGRVRLRMMVQGKTIVGPLCQTESEAQRLFYLKIQSLKDQRERGGPMLGDYLTSVLDRRTDLKSSTKRLHRNHIEGTIRGSCLDIPTGAITESTLERFLDERHDLAPLTMRTVLTIVHQGLSLFGNPARIKLPKARRATEPRMLTVKEQGELLLLATDPLDQTIIELALLCGLRTQELTALIHDDRDGAGIRISRALINGEYGMEVGTPKSENSHRWIPLPESLKWIGSGTGAVVGVGLSGAAQRFARLVKGTKFQNVSLHDLRHVYGMNLLEAGVDVRTAAELMGHDPTMLVKIYAKSRQDLKQDALRKVESYHTEYNNSSK